MGRKKQQPESQDRTWLRWQTADGPRDEFGDYTKQIATVNTDGLEILFSLYEGKRDPNEIEDMWFCGESMDLYTLVVSFRSRFENHCERLDYSLHIFRHLEQDLDLHEKAKYHYRTILNKYGDANAYYYYDTKEAFDNVRDNIIKSYDIKEKVEK